MRRALLYARRSIEDGVKQDLVLMIDACQRQGWQVEKECFDLTPCRLSFQSLLRSIPLHRFDIVVSMNIQYLGDSVKDIISFINLLKTHNMGLYLIDEAVNTDSPAGDMLFSLFSSLSQYEQGQIRAKISDGLRRAVGNGKRLGRPTNVNDSVRASVRVLRQEGWSIHKIAKELHIGVGTTSKIVALT